MFSYLLRHKINKIFCIFEKLSFSNFLHTRSYRNSVFCGRCIVPGYYGLFPHSKKLVFRAVASCATSISAKSTTHSSVAEGSRLLGCWGVSTDKYLLTFGRIVIPSSSRLSTPCIPLRLLDTV